MIHYADTSFLCSAYRHPGAQKFLTFDTRQQALARRAGLEVVPG